jgi:hypothetical protein
MDVTDKNFVDEFTLTCETVEGLVHIGCSLDVQRAEPPQDAGGRGGVNGRKQTRHWWFQGKKKEGANQEKFENKETFFTYLLNSLTNLGGDLF